METHTVYVVTDSVCGIIMCFGNEQAAEIFIAENKHDYTKLHVHQVPVYGKLEG